MSDSIERQTICNDCAFHTLVAGKIQCIHPDELEVIRASMNIQLLPVSKLICKDIFIVFWSESGSMWHKFT